MELTLSVNAPTGVSPAAVQWVLNYPAADFSSASIAAVNEGGKSVNCQMGVGSAACVMWGENNTQMVDGAAATISLVISPSTLDTSSQVQISNPMAAAPDAFAFNSSATGGTVTILQPAALDGFSCIPVTITPPAISTCTVWLTAPAPSSGATVALHASAPAVTIPSVVTVAPGFTSAEFTATPLTLSSQEATTLTASYLGVNEGFGLVVNPAPVVLVGVAVSPGYIEGGQTAKGTVTLSAPAGNGGVVVALASSNSAVATVPSSVTVPAGSTTALFTVNGITPPRFTRVLVSGSYGGVTNSASLGVRRY